MRNACSIIISRHYHNSILTNVDASSSCENINIYDLKGVSRSQITSDTFEMIKVGNQVMTAFPEVSYTTYACISTVLTCSML